MNAVYPVAYRGLWTRREVVDKVDKLCRSAGFTKRRYRRHVHYGDRDRMIAEIVRDYHITEPIALRSLASKCQALSSNWRQNVYRWASPQGEVVLVLAGSNVHPWPATDVATSGTILMGCGWLELIVPENLIEQFQRTTKIRELPLLYRDAEGTKVSGTLNNGS